MPQPPATPFTLAEGLSREFLLHHRLCPKSREPDGTVVVAVAPNAILDALDDIAVVYRAKTTVDETSSDEVDRLIERLTTNAERSIELARADSCESSAPGENLDDLTADVRDLANQPPVVRYVNLLV